MSHSAEANGNQAQDGGKENPGRVLLSKAREILWASDRPEDAKEILDQIDQLPAPKRMAPVRIKLNALKTLAQWRLTGEINPNYQNLNEARLQLWEIETDCPIFEFQKLFLQRITEDYPKAKGPRELSALYQSIDNIAPAPLLSPKEGVVVIRRPGATRTFLVFTGLKLLISGLTGCLWDRAIAQSLGANIIICYDTNRRHFLGGIETIGNRAETVTFLRTLLEEFQDTSITAIGGSAGVFGALHASCDLGIEHVVASSGPTSLELGFADEDRQVYKKIYSAAEAGEIELVDLPNLVAASDIKRIDFFVGKLSEFDMAQMNALRDKTDVVVPHLYDSDAHSVIVPAIIDGSYRKAVTAFSE